MNILSIKIGTSTVRKIGVTVCPPRIPVNTSARVSPSRENEWWFWAFMNAIKYCGPIQEEREVRKARTGRDWRNMADRRDTQLGRAKEYHVPSYLLAGRVSRASHQKLLYLTSNTISVLFGRFLRGNSISSLRLHWRERREDALSIIVLDQGTGTRNVDCWWDRYSFRERFGNGFKYRTLFRLESLEALTPAFLPMYKVFIFLLSIP